MQTREQTKEPIALTSRFSAVRILVASVLIGILIVCGSNLPVEAGSDAESANSVVKITAKSSTGQVSYATGFVWQKPTFIATALHAVAGSAQVTIYSEAQKKVSAAKIVRVHKESDLALLEMERDLGLTPVQAETVDPNSQQEYFIWGYPHNVNTMQGDYIRFSKSLNQQQPTLQSILKVSDEVRKQLEQQGFPSINAKILRIGTTIQPGHSGAPIFTAQGNLIGIGDGGLRGGVARINWAIPAEPYLPQLSTSNDPIPAQTSLQANLYRSEEEDSARALKPTITNTVKQSLEYVTKTTLSEILQTLPNDDDALEEDLADLESESDYDFGQEALAIYDNPEVGVSLAVPAEMIVEAQQDLFLISAPQERIRMFVKMSKYADMDLALHAAQAFSDGIRRSGVWEKNPEEDDDFRECDAEEGWCFYTFARSRFSENGDDVVQVLDESWELLEEGQFLGAAVITDLPGSARQDKLQSLLIFCLDHLVTYSIQ